MSNPQQYLLSATELHSLWLTDGFEMAPISCFELSATLRMALRYRGYITDADGVILNLCCKLPGA